MRKIILTSVMLSLGTLTSSIVLASSSSSSSSSTFITEEGADVYRNLYRKYIPDNTTWAFFDALQTTGQVKHGGVTYTADQAELNSQLPGMIRGVLCFGAKIIGIENTRDDKFSPQLWTNLEVYGSEISYQFAYQTQNTKVYKDQIFTFSVKPQLSSEDQEILDRTYGPMVASAVLQKMPSELMPLEDEQAAEAQKPGLSAADIAVIGSRYVAREQAIRKAIDATEKAVTAIVGEEVVIISNVIANLAGYGRAGEVLVERSIGLDRQDHDSARRHLSEAIWHGAGYFFSYGRSAQYLANAAANLTVGADTITQGVTGEGNDRSCKENRILATSNVVKAGVCMIPFGGAMIAASGVAAHYLLGNEESLTAYALHRLLGKDVDLAVVVEASEADDVSEEDAA